MTDDGTKTSAPAQERRFFSDQLMMDLCGVLVEKKLVTRAQIDQLNSRRTLTGESMDKMLVKESLVRDIDVLQDALEADEYSISSYRGLRHQEGIHRESAAAHCHPL